jgi:hypothetical protein
MSSKKCLLVYQSLKIVRFAILLFDSLTLVH